jgi:hypothetical protein
MLTFFTTAKPFRGHSETIQRNALKSWTLLGADVEGISLVMTRARQTPRGT